MKHFVMTVATASALSASAVSAQSVPRRVLATVSVDVENQDTGTTSTTVLGLHDGEAPADVAGAFCASVEPPSAGCDVAVSDALQQRFQERIDHDMQFYFHVNNMDRTNIDGSVAPFLFFRGDDVNEAVASYLHAYGMATQKNFDMLVQASHAKLVEKSQAAPTSSSSSAGGSTEAVETMNDANIEVFVPPISASKHCRAATYTFGDYVECVRELRHGHLAMQIWTPPVVAKRTTSVVQTDEDVTMFVMSAFIFVCCCIAAGIMWHTTEKDELVMVTDSDFQVVTEEAVAGFVEQQAKENNTVHVESSKKKPRRSSRRRFGTSINNAL
jgi:hypothetical protein